MMIRGLLLLCLLAFPASAQMLLLGAGAPPVSASYAGPGDVVSGAGGWYGLRAYDAAYAAPGTNKAITIRRASDNATSDIVILSSGYLDTSTATTFCNATTCFVSKIYDQSGNSRDLVQGTDGSQPQLILSCAAFSSRPCMTFSGTQFLLGSVASSTIAQPISWATVARYTATAAPSQTTLGAYGAGTSTMGGLQFYSPTSSISLYAGGAYTLANSALINTSYSYIAAFNGASSAYCMNTTCKTTGVNPGTGTGNEKVGMGIEADGTSNPLKGSLTEAGFWPAVAFTPTQMTNICKNQLYWGAWGC